MNVIEIEEAFEELASAAICKTEFPFRLAAAVGSPQATVSKLRNGSGNRSDVKNGVLLNGKFHFLPAPEGRLHESLDAVSKARATASRKVRIAVSSDGIRLAARDLKTQDAIFCDLTDLKDHFGFFLPLAGFERFKAADENPVDIRATSRLTRLYDALVRENPDWARDERRHDMNVFMTRIIFCFFAEDTGILPDSLFSRVVTEYGGRDGETVREVLLSAFRAMNTETRERGNLPAWVREFPYVNGGIFAGTIDAPRFGRTAYSYLKEAGSLNWKEINPDIFGSMIQSIADPAARAELGMHYTSVPNILKVLGPLFLNQIDVEMEKVWDKPKALEKLIKRLARIRVFDPACGSGNFLVVAYRELRAREIKILRRLEELGAGGQLAMWSEIRLSNFYGIEISDFAAETAKLALFTAEHQANRRFEEAFGRMPPSLPLRSGANIKTDNALRLRWDFACSPKDKDKDEEVYIVGNPPFLGSRNESAEQKEDKAYIFEGRIDSFKKLDLVCCWFLKAADMVRRYGAKSSLVATNSICQGNSWPAPCG